jgi:lysozyme
MSFARAPLAPRAVVAAVAAFASYLIDPAAGFGLAAAHATVVCPVGSTLQGVDVSSSNGSVNWAQVASAGYSFAVARVTDGDNFADPMFAANWSGIAQAGMVRGAYHFFRASQDPAAQVSFMMQRLGSLAATDLPVILDLEVTDGQTPAVIIARVQTWLSLVQQGTGKVPIVETSASFWSTLGGPTQLGGSPLWVQDFGVSCPNVPAPWTNWFFWMNSGTATVPGISGTGAADTDVFNGNLVALRAFASPSATAPATGPASIALLAGLLIAAASARLRTERRALKSADGRAGFSR